jgi:hypothetical protein
MKPARPTIFPVRRVRAAAILLFVTGSAVLQAADYYVAKNGSDTNAGTLAAPFLTIQKAADVAVAGDTVFVRTGTYRETVRPAASGDDAASQITFQPYNNEDVTVTGTDLVGGPWTVHSGNIWKCDVPADGSTDVNSNKVTALGDFQVLVEGWSAIEARWPNNTSYDPNIPSRNKAGLFTSGNDTLGTATIRYSSPPTWAVGAKINFWPGVSYFLRTGNVTSRNSSSIGVTYTSLGNTAYSAKSGDLFYLWGKLEALDVAGEFFFDTAASRLYLWAPHNADPNQLKVELKRRRYAFDLSGRNWVTVRGFRILAANVNVSSNAITLDSLRVLYASHLSTDVGTWSSNLYGMTLNGYSNTIKNSDIAYSAGSGVGATGHYLTIQDNIITDVDYLGANFAGVYLYNSTSSPPGNNLISRNTIVNCAASGIFYNTQTVWTDSASGVTRILNNRVSSVCLQCPDNGNIYTSGNGANTEIAYNALSDNRANATGNSYNYPVYGVTGAGIYLDIGVANFDIHHNVTFGSMYQAVRVNNAGKNLKIRHNTLLADSVSLANDYANTGTNFTGNDIRNNIFRKPVNDNGNIPASEISAKNLFSTTDPLFTDSANNDLTLTSASPAINQGDDLGYTYSGAADHGAYEYGITAWQAGPNISAQALPAPRLWTATAGAGSAALKWMPAPGWRYSVWRSDTSGYGYEKLATIANDTITYSDTGLTSGGPYYYAVKIERLGVESAVSNEIAVTPTGSWPSAPTGLTATTETPYAIQLAWTDASSNETGFEVYRKTGATGTYTLVTTTAANATTYPDSGLAAGQTYIYRIRAINASGSSVASNEASAIPLTPYQEWAYAETGSITADPEADPDGDGLRNLLEYAFGTQPGTADAASFAVDPSGAGILIENGSFESTTPSTLPDGTQAFFDNSGYVLANWTEYNGADGTAGYVYNRNASQWTNGYGSADKTPFGKNILGLGRGGAASVIQSLGTVRAGESYTFSGRIGRPTDLGTNATGGYTMTLYLGATPGALTTPLLTLNNASVADPALGTWVEWSADTAVITPAQDGQYLTAYLYAATGSWPSCREFDLIAVEPVCDLLVSFPLVESATDLAYTVQTSTDLVAWTDGATYTPTGSGFTRADGTGTIAAGDTDNGSTRTITEGILPPSENSTRQFVRIKITR